MEGYDWCERIGCLLWEIQLMRCAFGLWLLAFVCLWQQGAHAQVVLPGFPPGVFINRAALDAAPVAGYQGPGDITPGAIAFYSCGRSYNAAYASGGGAACTVVDTATGSVSCVLPLLSTGYVNTTACNSTACLIACSVSRMNDQTGNGNDVVQATLANMPGLTFNAQNGLPCAAGTNNAAMRLVTAGNITQALPVSATAVTERTGATNAAKIAVNGANAGLGFAAVANTVSSGLGGTTVTLGAADNAFHALLGVGSATAPLFAVDSNANTTTSTQGTTALSSTEGVAGRPAGTQGLLSGFVCEAGLWLADLNSSYQAMLANMRSASVGWNF
jgi:hypothetical protein